MVDLTCQEDKRMITNTKVNDSGEFVMHKSIRVLESEVTRVGSLINWQRPYVSKIFVRKEEM